MEFIQTIDYLLLKALCVIHIPIKFSLLAIKMFIFYQKRHNQEETIPKPHEFGGVFEYGLIKSNRQWRKY